MCKQPDDNDKTIMKPPYLKNVNSYTVKAISPYWYLYIENTPVGVSSQDRKQASGDRKHIQIIPKTINIDAVCCHFF